MTRPSELADLIERLVDAIPFISEKDGADARAAVASLRAEPSRGHRCFCTTCGGKCVLTDGTGVWKRCPSCCASEAGEVSDGE